MKKIILITFLFVSKFTIAATIPSHWLGEINKNKNTINEELKFEKDLCSIFNSQLHALDSNTEEKLKRKSLPFGFNFSHYVTDFSVSRSGLFGFSAYKAKSALEVKYAKKTNSHNKTLEETNHLIFNGTSDDDFIELSEKVVEIALASGKIKNESVLENQVNKTIQNLKYIIQSTDNKEFKNWDLAGMRVELSFAASGKILWIASATPSVRIRLEWKKVKRNNENNHKNTVYISNIANMLLYDLDRELTDKSFPGFGVKKVNVGVGISYKGGFLGLAKAKAAFVGFLSFIPVKKNTDEQTLTNEIINGDIPVITDQINEKGFRRFSRSLFRNGLRRSLSTVKSFATAANQKSNYWEVQGLKAVFDLSKKGFLGLSSVSGKSVIEVELKRL